MPSQAVRFCPLCSKPFTSDSSHKRHVIYCRRTQNKEKVRRKPCNACVVAKSRCSFAKPCSRCNSKGLDCMYHEATGVESTDMVPRYDDQKTSRESADALAEALIVRRSDQLEPPAALYDDRAEEPMQEQVEGIILDAVLDGTLIAAYESEHVISKGQVQYGTVDDLMDDTVTTLLAHDHPNLLVHDHANLLELFDAPAKDSQRGVEEMYVAGHELDRKLPLTAVTMDQPLARKGASLVIAALCAIPGQMVRKETFPSFIHPQWGHAELPEPLAICMRIAQMFASRTKEVSPFIWRTILSEQRRMLELAEDPSLSSIYLFAAIQAHMVYMIMRVVDGAAQDTEWVQEMSLSQRIICERFLAKNDGHFYEPETTKPSTTWDNWIYAESRRRTSAVWFLMTRTINVYTVPECSSDVAIRDLALPAPKTQWEARSWNDWIQGLADGSPDLQSFGGLIDAHKQCDEQASTQLNTWNATTDHLGWLLNVAATMWW